MIPVKPHLSQLQSSNHSKHKNLQTEMEEISDKLEDERQKKTLVFYVNKLTRGVDNVSLFVPIKGSAKRVYVKLEEESTQDLNVSIKNEKRSEILSTSIDVGETFKSTSLNHEIDYEAITATVEGEVDLENISICIDIFLN